MNPHRSTAGKNMEPKEEEEVTTMPPPALAAVPPWLEPLLSTAFFTICQIHGDAPRGECNMFCLDCCGNGDASFCFYCRSSMHKDHRVIQIRRSSYHDVVRVAEIQKALDISGVQTYVINSARVMFLNERPQPKAGGSKGGIAHLCEICERSLLDPFRFCSLGCKLVGVKRNGNASFSLEGRNMDGATAFEREIARRERDTRAARETGGASSRRGQGDNDRQQHERGGGVYPPTPTNSNARRRKGIPHRAPFKS